MTIKEAIRILDPETSRDALWKYEGSEARLASCNEACEVACSVMRHVEQWQGCGKCKHFNETGYSNDDKEHPELRSGWCENLRKEVQACWYCADHAYGDVNLEQWFEANPEWCKLCENTAERFRDLLLKYAPTQSELEEENNK